MTHPNILDKRVQRSRKAFKDALCSLYAKKNIADISVSDIVKSSGYSRSAFYGQFFSKENFLISIVDDEIDIYTRAVTSLPWYQEDSECSPDIDYILPVSTKLAYHVYENQELYRIILSNKLFVNTVDYFCTKAHAELHRKVKIEYFKSVPYDKSLINFDLYYFVRVYDFLIVMKYWLKNDFCFTPEYIAEQEFLISPNKASIHKNW